MNNHNTNESKTRAAEKLFLAIGGISEGKIARVNERLELCDALKNVDINEATNTDQKNKSEIITLVFNENSSATSNPNLDGTDQPSFLQHVSRIFQHRFTPTIVTATLAVVLTVVMMNMLILPEELHEENDDDFMSDTSTIASTTPTEADAGDERNSSEASTTSPTAPTPATVTESQPAEYATPATLPTGIVETGTDSPPTDTTTSVDTTTPEPDDTTENSQNTPVDYTVRIQDRNQGFANNHTEVWLERPLNCQMLVEMVETGAIPSNTESLVFSISSRLWEEHNQLVQVFFEQQQYWEHGVQTLWQEWEVPQFLNYFNTSTFSLEPLRNLTHLERLQFNIGGVITELSALATLPRFNNLRIDGITLGSRARTQLGTLTNLRTLSLISVNVEGDYSFLLNLPNLEWLDARLSRISNLHHFRNLTSLTHLNLSGNPITCLTPLENLTNLRTLDISHQSSFTPNPYLNNITPLRNMTNLQSLHISANQIGDLMSLQNMGDLRTLYITAKDISSVAPIAHLSSLEHLRINTISEIRDYILLGQINSLREVNLSAANGNTNSENRLKRRLSQARSVAFSESRLRDFYNDDEDWM
ncbi:MAG: leucine-rich repeat domain-containing protein [Oscillospiraceae bacterium]|nr:leucine-rich repeat domain-containing protein [Oscillospiraceae bacterium]